MKNTYYYIGANPTVDFVLENPKGEILMIKRPSNSPAEAGKWALPGGFVDSSSVKGEEFKFTYETPEQAVLRELEEETKLKMDTPAIKAVGVFEGNQRDPRDNDISWSKSYAFYYKMSEEEFASSKYSIQLTSEADDFQWVHPDNLSNLKIAFDHDKIISKALTQNLKKVFKP